jgi:hypothetical protein
VQCLYSNGGYTYLDVRSALEVDEVGKVRDSVNIPWVLCSRVWDPQEQKKVIKKEDNPDFIAQVRQQQDIGLHVVEGGVQLLWRLRAGPCRGWQS